MNKKVLSAILFSALFAGTGTFTSCIDNDEPAGIEELRGAKAELIRAKVAVEQAEAARILAVAEVEKANAAKAAALAKQEEAKVKIEEAKAEAQAATTAEAKAKAEKAIAEYQQQMEIAALDHQASILAKQEALAKAERSYELAMKQIEIAKAVMSEKDKVTIAMLEAEVLAAKVQYDGAVEKYRIAENAHYDAAILADNETGWEIDYAEWHLKYAKADLAAAEKTLAKYVEFEKNEGVETADWRAEIQEIEDSLAQITKTEAKVELEKQQALNSKEFKAYVDTVYAANAALALEKDTLKNKFKLAEEVKDSLLFAEFVTAEDKDTIVAFVKGAKKTDVLASLAGAAYMKFNGDSTSVEVAENYGEGLIAKLETEIAGYTTEKKYWLDSIAAVSDLTNAATKKASDDSIAAYKSAKAAYEAAKDISVADIVTYSDQQEPMTDTISGGAFKTFREAINKSGATNEDKLKAKQAFADALVKFYKELPSAQVGLTQITLKLTTNGRDSYEKKTAQAWLEDASMKDVYLDNLIAYFNNDTTALWGKNTNTGGEKYETTGAVTTGKNLTGVFSKFNSKADMLTALQTASRKAFGAADQYLGTLALPERMKQNGYLHTEPTAADVKAVDPNYDTTGAYGRYLLSLDKSINYQAENYEAIIADLEAAKTKWVALVAEIVAEAQTATADIKAANVAKGTAELNLSNYSASITKVQDLALAELGGEKRALEAIKGALVVAVNAYLSEGEYQNAVQFEAWLAKQVKDAEFEVILAKAKVTEKENNLKQAQDGKFTAAEALAAAERELAAAEEVLAEAEEDLTEALENLEKGITIMAGSAE